MSDLADGGVQGWLMSEYIWYAGYGSNLSEQRFLCYVLGGKPLFGKRRHTGCTDRTPPVESRAFLTDRRLYFALPRAGSRTENWGPGGVAFMDPKAGEDAETICRLWKISKKQFAEVWEQEGPDWYDVEIPLGEVGGCPVVTISSRRRLANILPPSETYLKTIAIGLRETCELSDREIAGYLAEKQGIKDYPVEQNLEKILTDLPRNI